MSEYGEGSVQIRLKLFRMLDLLIRVRRRNLRVIWVGGSLAVTKLIDNVGKGIVLPADKNVPAARVVVYNLGNALLVITVAGGVNAETKVGSYRLDSVERASAGSIWRFS